MMMTCRSDAAGIIRDEIPIGDVVRFYGYEPDRSGFIQCPFHDDPHPSLKVDERKNRWKCYGCGASGSNIDFVMLLYDLSFRDALKRLDEDFRLGLLDEPIDRDEIRRREAERERKRKEQEAWDMEYKQKCIEYRHLHKAYLVGPDDPEYERARCKLPILEQWFEDNPYGRKKI